MGYSRWLAAGVFIAMATLGVPRAEAVVTQYKIDDLLEPPIKVFVNTGAGDVEIGGGCNALVEKCFVTIPLLAPSPVTATDVVYLTDGGDLLQPSDILVFREFVGENTAELLFCSDPDCPPPFFNMNPPSDTSIDENGNYQLLAQLRGARFGDGIDLLVRSDVESEPSAVFLLVAGLALVHGWRRRGR